jgi:DNA-3-methyladenine glycosylase II
MFQSLARSIVSQQLAKQAAIAILARLDELLPESGLEPAAVVRLGEERLRKVGLSRSKASYLIELARRVAKNQLDLRSIADLAEDQVRELLLQEAGVGPWTVDMFLIFELQRPDVFPSTDVAIKRAMIAAYELHPGCAGSELAALAENWRPYRSVASRYLYAYLDRGLARLAVGRSRSG